MGVINAGSLTGIEVCFLGKRYQADELMNLAEGYTGFELMMDERYV